MPERENLRLAQRGFDAWNAHDAERYGSLLSEDHVAESDIFSAPLRGRQAAIDDAQRYFRAFPDLHFDVEQMMANGDHVVIRWRARGTHRGDLMGIPPTNRQAIMHGCTFNELKDGRIARAWVYWDTGHLLRQLGLLAEPG